MKTVSKLRNYAEVLREGDSEYDWNTSLLEGLLGPFKQEVICALTDTGEFDWFFTVFRDKSGLILVHTDEDGYALPFYSTAGFSEALFYMLEKPDVRWHELANQLMDRVAVDLLSKSHEENEDADTVH